MQVIEQKGQKHDSPEEAGDHLAGLSHMPGFVFGYVDDRENRAIMFFQDAFPGQELQRGQHRRTLVFAHRPEPKTDPSIMAAIGDAIANGKDLTKR
jgi:hypothetical protein